MSDRDKFYYVIGILIIGYSIYSTHLKAPYIQNQFDGWNLVAQSSLLLLIGTLILSLPILNEFYNKKKGTIHE